CPGGDIDAGFGTAGVFRLDVGGFDNVDWGAQGIDLQPDGRIVVAGVAGTSTNRDMLVMRLHEDGTLDSGFGANGLAVIDFGTPTDVAESVRVQSDGSLVVAGQSGVRTGVARLLTNGLLDPSFAATGYRSLALTADSELVNGQVTLANGDLRLCGQGLVTSGSPTLVDMLVYGLHGDGTLDSAFPSTAPGGLAAIDFFASDEFASCDVIDASGRLIVAGATWHDVTGFDFALARLLPDGTYDPTFTDGAGLPGRVVTDFSGTDDGTAQCATPGDNSLVCAGSTGDATGSRFGVVRYLATGALDPAFGTNGKVTIDMGDGAEVRAVVVLGDGRLVVGGFATSTRGDRDLALAVCDADGTLASGFGEGGRWFFDVGAAQRDDAIHALRVDARGRLVIYGDTSSAPGNNDIVVMRVSL
ncbi:MAG: hypothetical protein AAB426_03345, partial [Myxococcota bacterium]